MGQWDHRSFYRMKDTIARTRSFLAKCVKDYENILNKPVDEVLNQDKRRSVEEEAASDAKGGKAAAAKFAVAILPTRNFVVRPSEISSELPKPISASPVVHGVNFGEEAAKIFRISGRMRKICSDSILPGLSRKCDQEIQNLAVLGNTVIDYSAELRRITEAKNQPQKKRALVDLFNHLKEMGVSFHEAHINQNQKNMSQLMALPANDVTEIFGRNAMQGTEREIVSLVANAESYYYRNMSLLVKVRQAKNRASPDLSRMEVSVNQKKFNFRVLTVEKVEKLTKYMEHLMTLTIKQRSLWLTTALRRQALARVTRSYNTLASTELGGKPCKIET